MRHLRHLALFTFCFLLLSGPIVAADDAISVEMTGTVESISFVEATTVRHIGRDDTASVDESLVVLSIKIVDTPGRPHPLLPGLPPLPEQFRSFDVVATSSNDALPADVYTLIGREVEVRADVVQDAALALPRGEVFGLVELSVLN